MIHQFSNYLIPSLADKKIIIIPTIEYIHKIVTQQFNNIGWNQQKSLYVVFRLGYTKAIELH